ncbi:hypothetical protein FA95DRAFT_1486740 [Auriscalpium vulgare]|uniref:Uncharacterized protein n=1 Tax=Auriscalpium vulgare TaxID=40419 RepID=A0ACB8S3S0_9AGAM|nr:hypothetical protein FA95DRAFT_1486740 [Auriscalpium vulgare]
MHTGGGPGAATGDAAGDPGSPELAEIFTGYLSDEENAELSDTDEEDYEDDGQRVEVQSSPGQSSSQLDTLFPIRPPPPRKRRKLDVPVRQTRQIQQGTKQKMLKSALTDIERKIKSKRTIFQAGREGLQARRASAMKACLHLIVNKHRGFVAASENSAEVFGFAAVWGGRKVRQWVRRWIAIRELPDSLIGHHSKTFSLLEDPNVCTELRSYVRSEKWAMNPEKLAEFSQNKLIPEAAKQYMREVVNREIPEGLKKYLELELFPRIHLRPSGKGITIRTARRWLRREGFPQANDLKAKSWVLDGEHALKKKGQGRGVHQSDVICSTVGWLKQASQSLEYGKNYEGYWTGELLISVQLKQKIIPAFEEAHGPGYQALFLVDNSQGHSAYAENSLLTSRMNLNPGGKQARLRDGWFIKDGCRVAQAMIFPCDHLEFPNQPKGMKHKYLRDNCDYTFQTLKDNLPKAMSSIAVTTIRLWEHRMQRWMSAYGEGLGAKEAQAKVKKFSSKHYKSHRRVPETLAHLLDM